ncbi:MAG: S9 family peptidase [Bacteroidales bacterium]|nr:S9 family peptidase [Bacteroidales bacterium]
MKRTLFLISTLLLLTFAVQGQKKALDHSDYDSWKSISGSSITDDGRWITYAINPQQGDGWLYFYDVNSSRLDSVERGSAASVSPGSRYIAYTIRPKAADVRQAKVKKVKEENMPKNSLAIRQLPSGNTVVIERVRSFSVPSKGSEWMAYLLEKKLPEKKEVKEGEGAEAAEKPAATPSKKEPEQKGTELVIINPVTSKEHRFNNVLEFDVATDGLSISFVQVSTDTAKIDNYTVSMFDTKKETVSKVFEGKGTLKKITSNKIGDKLAFMYTQDTAKIKIYNLYMSDKFGAAKKLVDADTKGMPEGWCMSENSNFTYSDDYTRLFFGTAAKPVKEPEDTLLAEEKFSVDVWSWHDDILQPMQKKQLQTELRRNFQAVYHLDRNVMFQLADESMPSVRLTSRGDGDMALGSSNLKYRKESSWSTTGYSDYYYVNVETGERRLLMEKNAGSFQVSPGGKYILFWCINDRAWKSMPSNGGPIKTLTSNNEVVFFNELHDTPDEPNPYGVAGWIEGERYVVVYDAFDLWMLDAEGTEKPVNLTMGAGRKSDIRFRYVNLDREEQYISRKGSVYLSAFSNSDKKAGYYTLAMNKPATPAKLILDDYSFGSPTKPKNADVFMFTRGTYVNYPEIHVSDLKFAGIRKVSTTNPQQSQYNWGTVELVEWTSFDRSTLQGLLYKPENFDPAKKYPMIVYFYERSSDGLHGYSAPAPSASTVNRTLAVSNEYLVFVPDIPYVEGYPGESCYNAVISGTYALLNRFSFIDKDRLGLDGQSWGGYQIAWLVTQTDLFAAAFAGAPVSNMISAYGGIRWGTGMSRMFQYEDTQSRIGGTLWEKPIQFIENSPIFFVPKIHTPLLIMHNDEDGAVPWYQGIEFFVALRRLEKPAWLLTYNTEDHNLVRRPARMDLSIRKMQFFDHYLKGEPMPSWMKNGVPQTEKGKNQGYELVK